MNTRNKSKKGGYVANYNNTSSENDYMLYTKELAALAQTPAQVQAQEVYFPPNSDFGNPNLSTSSLYALPNMTGGSRTQTRCSTRVCDSFEFDNSADFLYSLKGGCSCNTSSVMGGSSITRRNKKVDGGSFALTPYITAIAILAARLLTDKNVGFYPMQGGNKTLKKRTSRK